MPPEIREQAKELGLMQSQIAEVYRELRSQQRLELDWEWSIRKRVWEIHAYTPGSREFWRHGMQVKYPRAFGDGDMTLIPNWDTTAQSIACEFPGFAADGNTSEELFQIIARPHTRLPTALETWQQALAACTPIDTEPVPF